MTDRLSHCAVSLLALASAVVTPSAAAPATHKVAASKHSRAVPPAPPVSVPADPYAGGVPVRAGRFGLHCRSIRYRRRPTPICAHLMLRTCSTGTFRHSCHRFRPATKARSELCSRRSVREGSEQSRQLAQPVMPRPVLPRSGSCCFHRSGSTARRTARPRVRAAGAFLLREPCALRPSHFLDCTHLAAG
jgi:hypothetical protein